MKKLARRELLIWLGLGGVALLGGRAAGRTRHRRKELWSWSPETRHSAQQVGAEYLRCHPEEADPELLLAKLLGGHWPEDPARWLRDRVRGDFARAEVVELKGWVLARSEARVCALAALS